ncbi:MAG TPA: segregation/condensation protein A [Pirellulales bacterium]|nr:segregation/condensation protein A [Pirellulales bacterium]
MSFRVDLDIFRGPLDLLLYLVRKHEVEVVEIPIAAVAEQFLEHLSVLEQLDVNAVGDFLEMASTLIELKSRLVLPRSEEEAEIVLDDPRHELVERLLEYKKFKDAASILEERSREWQERFPRLANDLPVRQRNLADEPIHELELWDLVSAFGRVIRDNQPAAAANIVYDETPIHVYMSRIHGRLLADERVAFTELFGAGMHKSTLVGMFLAILELVRHHGVRAEQDQLHGEIWILPGERLPPSLDASAADNYDHRPAAKTEDAPERQAADGGRLQDRGS